MTKRNSFGVCELCGERKAKAQMAPHLKKCIAARSGVGRPSSHLLLQARASGAPEFWLIMAVTPEAKLKQVDALLRRVWLECCGHMSRFYRKDGRDVGMTTAAGGAFDSIGSSLAYVYDFGSSTELVASLLAIVEAPLTKPVRLVARNEPLTWPCDVCEQPAASLCVECADEYGGFYCGVHSEGHECGEDMLLPVVNSPRMGVCGYTGQ